MIQPIESIYERYTFITQAMVPNVDIGRYLISDINGIVIDTWNNRQVHFAFCGEGYFRVALHLETGGAKGVLVHRLVAMAYVPGDWSLQVNHIDGKKYNNCYTNLEWVTPRENLMHALDNGLNHRGENKPNALLTNDQVHQICKYLELGYDYNYIVNSMNLLYIQNIHDILHDIKCGKSWKTISCNYDIPKYKIVNNRYLANDQVHIICEALLNNPKISNRELFEIIGLDVSTKEKYSKARHCIESIKAKKAYTDISNKYFGEGSTTSRKMYTQVSGNGEPLTGNAEGEDIV